VDEKDFLSALIEEGDKVIAEMNGAPPTSGGEALVLVEGISREESSTPA
jgi:hypothetical protein